MYYEKFFFSKKRTLENVLFLVACCLCKISSELENIDVYKNVILGNFSIIFRCCRLTEKFCLILGVIR